jgi:hypothetical protein
MQMMNHLLDLTVLMRKIESPSWQSAAHVSSNSRLIGPVMMTRVMTALSTHERRPNPALTALLALMLLLDLSYNTSSSQSWAKEENLRIPSHQYRHAP